MEFVIENWNKMTVPELSEHIEVAPMTNFPVGDSPQKVKIGLAAQKENN
jgi:deoxyribose-phosphate aldolase